MSEYYITFWKSYFLFMIGFITPNQYILGFNFIASNRYAFNMIFVQYFVFTPIVTFPESTKSTFLKKNKNIYYGVFNEIHLYWSEYKWLIFAILPPYLSPVSLRVFIMFWVKIQNIKLHVVYKRQNNESLITTH